MYKPIMLVYLFLNIYTLSNAQITEIYTDYGGFWKSTLTANNPILPTNSHNLLGFTRNGKVYATGVNNAALTANGVTSFNPTTFLALPVTFPIGGTINSGSSTYIATGTLYDGVLNGFSSPAPNLRITDVLTDGINGLNIGTGVTNMPATAALKFNVTAIDIPSISDTVPDILFSQTAQPSGYGYTLYFENSSGVMVGSSVTVNFSATPLGSYICDLYNLSYTTCDLATITTGNITNQIKEIRLNAFQFSDFGITALNAASVTRLSILPGGNSDPAFVAYNKASFTFLTPVITAQPQSQIICPDPTKSVTLSVTATGSALTYQWKKNGTSISGAIGSTYTISPALSSDAGNYDVYVTNPGGTVQSSIAYITALSLTGPTPATANIPTGNSITLSVTSGSTAYQWQKNGTNITGATSSSYIFNPQISSDGGSYTVNIANAANSSCPLITSAASLDTASVVLYSKAGGGISTLSTWGVYTDGNGTSPLTFLRPEHTFKISNKLTAVSSANLTIAGALDLYNTVLTITPITTLNAGQMLRTGTGTLSSTATSNLTVGGVSDLTFTTGSQVIKNLTISGGTVTLNTPLNITAGSAAGALVVSAGTFNTLNNLTLKSDVNGTATIGTSAGTINNKITIERYMPARRAWRLMTAPIAASGAPFVNAAWQEGATSSTSNPNPNFGTHITGGTIANGYDQSPTNSSSLKYYNGVSWVAVPNTYTTPITQYPGYLFFIRGNRSYNILATTSTITALSTTLRVKGNVNQGTQPGQAIPATGYALAGNPYASPIDFNAVIASSTNVKNRFRVWDPELGGLNGVGAYVLLDWGGSSYTCTPASAGLNGIIQAGQAFFIESSNGTSAGSLVINESHKNSTTSNIPFGRVYGGVDATIAVDLDIINSDSTVAVADGVLTSYNDQYNNAVDNDDAVKFPNNNENVSIISNGKTLSLEKRRAPVLGDTMHLKFTGIKNISYQFVIMPSDFAVPGLQPQLYDNYLGNHIYINFLNPTVYPFNITSDPLSLAPDRFGIVFKNRPILPAVTLTATAFDASSVAAEWKVDKEANTVRYELQTSNEADSFKTIYKVNALNNGGPADYKFNDVQLATYNNTYRVMSVCVNGDVKYSGPVNVKFIKAKDVVSIWPNPVTNNIIAVSLQRLEQAKYQYAIINSVGQVMLNGVINHAAGSAIETIKLAKKLSAGNYQFTIRTGAASYKTKLVIQ